MNLKDVQDFLVSQIEEEKLPALEFIEDTEVSLHIQVLPPETDLILPICLYLDKKNLSYHKFTTKP